MKPMIPDQHSLDTPYPVGPVHCYTAEIAGDLVLFDTGPPTPEAKQYLRETIDFNHLRHIVVTHCHIDHYGLAHWLEQETDATLYLPFRDQLKIVRHQERLQQMYDLLRQIGFPASFLDQFKTGMEDGSVFPPLPQNFRVIEEDLPAHLGLTILPCPGHSQSDLVLVRENWAITGDVMLRGIFQTPLLDVDLLNGQRFSNYQAYCNSLLKLATLREHRILPGHREQVDSVDSCLLFYLHKLLERARQNRQFPLTMDVFTIVDTLLPRNPSPPPFVSYLKASEIVFLRDFLADPERLRRTLEKIGLFSAVADPYQRALE
jgi:2,4-dienoyl-CoA reductase (NADPH2)